MPALTELPSATTEIKVNIPGVTLATETPAPKAEAPIESKKPASPNPLAEAPKADVITGEAPKVEPKVLIDTDVLGTGKQVQKTPAEFAAERKAAREEEIKKKLGLPELESGFTQAKADLARVELELQEIRLERDRLANEKEQTEALANSRKEELEKATGRYFDTFKAEIDPAQDPDFIQTAGRFASALSAGLPERIPVGDDEKRVFPEQMLSNPVVAEQMDNVMSHYAHARNSGNSAAIDIAVNAVAQIMGVPMVIDPDPTKCQGLLASNDPVFRQIETAMKSALPSWSAKAERRRHLVEQAPEIVKKSLLERERSIASNIKGSIFIAADEAEMRLRANPTDSAAVLSMMLEATPELREMVERTVAGFAPAFARMGQINMPTLMDNSKEAVEAHRRELNAYQSRLGQAMPAAVLGTIAGPIITNLVGQLKAMTARLGDVSKNTNPGSIEAGGTGAPPRPVIDTRI
jgi:hypothetical protein